MTAFTANIQKGGALVEDARRLVEVWDLEYEADRNLERIADQNLLAKRSRARSEDILRRVLTPRLIEPGPQVIEALKLLLPSPRSFIEAYYLEACRDDALLAALAEGPLYAWWHEGRVTIDSQEVARWIRGLAEAGKAPAWSEGVQIKVARGLLAALRDFGVIAGASRKEFEAPSLSLPGFGYAAFRLRELGASSRTLVDNAAWRRRLLDRGRVMELFSQADRLGLFHFAAAGSAVRVDWRQDTLAGAVSCLA